MGSGPRPRRAGWAPSAGSEPGASSRGTRKGGRSWGRRGREGGERAGASTRGEQRRLEAVDATYRGAPASSKSQAGHATQRSSAGAVGGRG
jgi:hypothetical protein